MQKKLLIFFLVIILLAGCTNTSKKTTLNPQKPIVINLWHAYNSHAKIVLDKLIAEFNDTVGLEKGIIVETYAYGTIKELDHAIYASAKNTIGSADMPHIFSASSDSAHQINSIRPLVPLTKYFTTKELAEYKKDFLEDGLIGTDALLKIIPITKSTEVLYLNKTDWDKFSQQTGYTTNDLQTWEDLLTVAKSYYEWSGGKAMFGINPLNTIMSITAQQLSQPVSISLDQNNVPSFNYNEDVARKIWDLFYIPHMQGFYKTASYSSDGVKSGELISYLGSSAGAAFFPNEVTLDSKQIYSIEAMILPYPTFKNGKPYTSQRGAGMCITASDEKHEYAAAEFLKWLTANRQNLTLAINTGYLPVKNSTLDSFKTTQTNVPAIVNSCNIATINMMKTHQFHANKAFSQYYLANNIFDNFIFDKIKNDLKILEARIKNGERRSDIINELTSEQAFKFWYQELQEKIIDAINSERK